MTATAPTQNTATVKALTNDMIALLRQLIAIPSFSKSEQGTAALIQQTLHQRGVTALRVINNVWARNRYFDKKKPTLLLHSHHDTVKPDKHYTLDPFYPLEKEGILYGLGSNDAGASLISLMAAFLHFQDQKDLQYNLIFGAGAEEEISGANGIEALLPEIGKIDCAIVGEPTGMKMAVAEKGLLVLDCVATGRAGHAAREEGENAIYKALKDIAWFRDFQFPKISPLLGPVKMSVTVMEAGTQHNIVPATCKFTVDVRVNDCYSHEEVLELIRQQVDCTVTPRSMRLRATSIDAGHPLVMAGRSLGLPDFGSATMSDKALMPFPALKIGPGDSARSHTADEYIRLEEIAGGIETYIRLIGQLLQPAA